MEAEFIAEFEVTLERYQDWSENPKGEQAVKEKRRGIRLRIAILICSVIIIILGIILRNYFEILMGIMFGMIAIDRLFFIVKRVAKRQYHSFLKKMGVEKWIRRVEVGDRVIVTDGIQSIEYDYQPETRMTDEGEYRGLWINKDIIIRIPKGSLVKGNEEEVTTWIYQKLKGNQKEIEGREAE